jgi:Family of unknown function (DUF6228)
MDEILIKAERETLLRFHSPERNPGNWLDRYVVTMSARHFNATITVENPPFGASPLALFTQMSDNWQGWQGKKEWDSLEPGEMSLSATHNRLGLALLSAHFRPLVSGQAWASSVQVEIELGSLAELASNAEAFFGR